MGIGRAALLENARTELVRVSAIPTHDAGGMDGEIVGGAPVPARLSVRINAQPKNVRWPTRIVFVLAASGVSGKTLRAVISL